MSINQYCIQQQIGKGSFATVYKAHCIKNDEKVAIKIISKALSKQEIQLAEKQIQMLEKINHKNIIKLYSHFYEGESYYMILQYCGQGDLQKLLKKQKRFSEQLVSLIAVEIINALVQLEKYNIAHRDIKLANIFVNDKFQIKLADLGFAKATSQQQLLKSYAGTPLIMAPEILQYKKYTNKCDVWSFGIILFYMLYGKFPFLPKNNGGVQELTQIVIKKPVQFFKNIQISKQAQDFIRKCLEKQPENRIRPQDMIKHPWIEKAKLKETKINDLIYENYRLSQIFSVQEQNPNFLNNQRLQLQFNESLKKIFSTHIKKYGQNLELLKQIIKSLQKSPNLNRNLKLMLYKLIEFKLKEIEQSKLILQFKNKSLQSLKPFEFNFCEFYKNSKPILDILKKSIYGKYEEYPKNLQNNLEREVVLQFLYIFRQLISNKNKANEYHIIPLIQKVVKLIKINLNYKKINISVQDNLNQKISRIVQEKITEIKKQQLLKILLENPNKNFITLINIFTGQFEENPKPNDRESIFQTLIENFITQKKIEIVDRNL